MPVYNIAAVAEALDVPIRQVDNILSRHEIRGVERKRRGVTRRIAPDAVVTLRLALELTQALHVPIGPAIEIANRLEESGGTTRLGDFGTASIDLDSLRTATLNQLDRAVELVGRRPRGRPVSRRPADAASGA